MKSAIGSAVYISNVHPSPTKAYMLSVGMPAHATVSPSTTSVPCAAGLSWQPSGPPAHCCHDCSLLPSTSYFPLLNLLDRFPAALSRSAAALGRCSCTSRSLSLSQGFQGCLPAHSPSSWPPDSSNNTQQQQTSGQLLPLPVAVADQVRLQQNSQHM